MQNAERSRASVRPAAGIILIVDDAETCAATLELACGAIAGTEVALVSSALEAVRLLRDRSRPVCAVITDLRMPRMDGFELIQFIRANPTYTGLPIIVVSADTDPGTPERARRLGADAYFSKPCSPGAVRKTLEQLLHANRSAL